MWSFCSESVLLGRKLINCVNVSNDMISFCLIWQCDISLYLSDGIIYLKIIFRCIAHNFYGHDGFHFFYSQRSNARSINEKVLDGTFTVPSSNIDCLDYYLFFFLCLFFLSLFFLLWVEILCLFLFLPQGIVYSFKFK